MEQAQKIVPSPHNTRNFTYRNDWNFRSPPLLYQPRQPLRALSRSQRAAHILKEIFHGHVKILPRGRLPRRNRRQRHGASHEGLAPHAPLAASVLLLIHQIAYAPANARSVAAEERPGHVGAVRQRSRTRRKLLICGGGSHQLHAGRRQFVQFGHAGSSPHP